MGCRTPSAIVFKQPADPIFYIVHLWMFSSGVRLFYLHSTQSTLHCTLISFFPQRVIHFYLYWCALKLHLQTMYKTKITLATWLAASRPVFISMALRGILLWMLRSDDNQSIYISAAPGLHFTHVAFQSISHAQIGGRLLYFTYFFHRHHIDILWHSHSNILHAETTAILIRT